MFPCLSINCRPFAVSASALRKLASSHVTPVSRAVRARMSTRFALVSSFAFALASPSLSTLARRPAASVLASTLPKSKIAPFFSAMRCSSATSTAPSAQLPGFASCPSPRPLMESFFVTLPASSVLSPNCAVMLRKRLQPSIPPSMLESLQSVISFSLACRGSSSASEAFARSASACMNGLSTGVRVLPSSASSTILRASALSPFARSRIPSISAPRASGVPVPSSVCDAVISASAVAASIEPSLTAVLSASVPFAAMLTACLAPPVSRPFSSRLTMPFSSASSTDVMPSSSRAASCWPTLRLPLMSWIFTARASGANGRIASATSDSSPSALSTCVCLFVSRDLASAATFAAISTLPSAALSAASLIFALCAPSSVTRSLSSAAAAFAPSTNWSEYCRRAFRPSASDESDAPSSMSFCASSMSPAILSANCSARSAVNPSAVMMR